MSKALKTPKLTKDSKLLCFDLETNGLHGQAFAIGAVVIDGHGKVHDEFTARCKLTNEVDEWVQANVLPAIEDMQTTHGDYAAMHEAFWRWYTKTEPEVDYVLVSNGYPVEYKFLLDCQAADLEERYWQHPFPILDLSSILLAKGLLTESSKSKIISSILSEHKFRPHHPLHDAKVTALAAFSALLD